MSDASPEAPSAPDLEFLMAAFKEEVRAHESGGRIVWSHDPEKIVWHSKHGYLSLAPSLSDSGEAQAIAALTRLGERVLFGL